MRQSEQIQNEDGGASCLSAACLCIHPCMLTRPFESLLFTYVLFRRIPRTFCKGVISCLPCVEPPPTPNLPIPSVLLEAGGLLKVGGQLLGLLRLDVELGAARFDFMGKGGHFWVLVFRWFRYMFELL